MGLPPASGQGISFAGGENVGKSPLALLRQP
jgi:hypothetical protein